MCGGSLTPNTPSTTTSFKVQFDHAEARWHAQVCSHSITHDGDVQEHGSLVREFGPFDGAADVLQWVYREAAALIRLMPVRDNVASPE